MHLITAKAVYLTRTKDLVKTLNIIDSTQLFKKRIFAQACANRLILFTFRKHNALLSGCGELAAFVRLFAQKVTVYRNPT